MSQGSSSSAGGAGLSTILLVVFVTLKLLHVIDWSWWWVLAPFWIPAILGVVILGGVIAYAWRTR